MYVIVYYDTDEGARIESPVIYSREEAYRLCEKKNAAMKKNFQHYRVLRLIPAGMNANVARAIDEVSAFVTEYESWNEGDERTHICTTGEYGTPVRLSLYTDQLRLLINGAKH